MTHELPPLPYSMKALEPVISAETLEYHYGKHHRGYVSKLNKLVVGTPLEKLSLEQIVRRAPPGAIFNNAAQAWNHAFFWNSLRPGGSEPKDELLLALERTFGTVEGFHKLFVDKAATQFGSGWIWLLAEPSGNLKIELTSNADNPITRDLTPLLVCDLWEHAYYIDYRNERERFVNSVCGILNWDFAGMNFLQEHGDRDQISA
jgi:Fe-Mn family superoxide dismutase